MTKTGSASQANPRAAVLPAAATSVLAIGIFVVDTITDLEIAVAVFYAVVVLVSNFVLGRRGVLAVASGCILLTVLSYFLTRSGNPEPGLVNGMISLSAIAAITYLSLRIKSAEAATLEARAQLAHVGRVTTLGELTASIAHEVNQPLAAVVTNGNACSRWLAAQPPNLAEARNAIDRIVKDANRASQLVERVRGLARREPSRRDRLDMNEIILEVVALTRSELQHSEIALRTQLSENLASVLGDRVRLQQAVLNLILNAVESMQQVNEGSRELLISSSMDDAGGVLVAFHDTGGGIDPARLDRLFEAFYTTKPGGMGMGLAITRTIVEDHGGRIWAAPEIPRGAVFRFSLPPARKRHA